VTGIVLVRSLESVRAMFKKGSEDKAPLDLNDIIQDVLGLVRGELQTQGGYCPNWAKQAAFPWCAAIAASCSRSF
jgi:hypothetical protein